MACNENRNTILEIDFSIVSDENNWTTNSSNTILTTTGGKLRLNPDDENTFFDRILGPIDPINNRVRIGVDMQIFRPIGSTDNSTNVVVQILKGNTLLGTGTACITNIESSQFASFHLDRTFTYDSFVGSITMRINVPTGFENHVELCDIKVEDFNFCDDNVRTFFIFDGLFDASRNAQSGIIKLNEWIVDGVETLTVDFFNDNNNNVLLPLSDWFFADSDIDGDKRIQDDVSPKSFNPFINSWGLDFLGPVPFFGGKPTAVTNGNDYGPGLLNIGIEKPQILNENLDAENGAIFIDIDLTKDLKIVMDIVVNENNTNLYVDPTYFRRYFIEWDFDTCQGKFFYIDINDVLLPTVDQLFNGFLYGITDQDSEIEMIDCTAALSFAGNNGTHEFLIDFGTETGQAGITFEAFNIPDRFTIIWDGMEFTTGFVGLLGFNQDLLNAGISPSDINLGIPSTGAGELIFNKSSASPNEAIIRVEAPLDGTAWNVTGICPQVTATDPVEVGVGTCASIPVSFSTVFVNEPDILNYIPSNGDIIFTDSGFTTTFNGSDQTFRMRIPTFPSPLILNVQFSIDSVGVVSNVQKCGPSPGPEQIETLLEDISLCATCWQIKVTVPASETRQVEFSGTFQSSAVYDAVTCTPVGTNITSDGITNISVTTTFSFGIDASQTGTLQSIIGVIVRDGATIKTAENFTRLHASFNC